MENNREQLLTVCTSEAVNTTEPGEQVVFNEAKAKTKYYVNNYFVVNP